MLSDDGAHANIFFGTFLYLSRHVYFASVRHAFSLPIECQRGINRAESCGEILSVQEDKEQRDRVIFEFF